MNDVTLHEIVKAFQKVLAWYLALNFWQQLNESVHKRSKTVLLMRETKRHRNSFKTELFCLYFLYFPCFFSDRFVNFFPFWTYP